MTTDRFEYEIFAQMNNCEQILNRMVNKLETEIIFLFLE